MKIYSIGSKQQLSILQQPAVSVKNIDGEIERLALDMAGTMKQAHGVGIAGPQVGDSSRIFVVGLPQQESMVFINPEITATGEKMSSFEEGCLSIPEKYGMVWRPAEVEVQAWTVRGKPFRLEAGGLLATVIQHELDHLNGVLFIDYLGPAKRTKILGHFGVENYVPVTEKDKRKID